jgi:hypothetical protein
MPFFGPPPPLRYPLLPFLKLPPEERNRALFVQNLIMSLGHRCIEFASAIELLDFCIQPLQYECYGEEHWLEEANKRKRWESVAANSAASTVYLFYEDMEFLGENLSRCKTLNGMVNHKIKRSATKMFSQLFPGFAGVRHSRLHDAKLYGTPESLWENVAGPEIHTTDLVGRTITSSFKGKIVRLEVSKETLAKLQDVRDLYWSAFMPISTR